MFSFFTKIFGTANHRIIRELQQEVAKINALEQDISNFTESELKLQTVHLKEKLSKGGNLDDIVHEAFAVVREVSKRVIGQRHYDVQIIGGLIMHKGMITEMHTGEGKTLVATLPAYLNSLTGKGVHIVTVNDYLAKRDSKWMGKIFEFLGLTVACVIGEMNDEDRKNAYKCDITYTTNNELGFDYLRDNMRLVKDTKVQRQCNYAIIDEVDSILIDEARTPLIISGSVDDSTELHGKINTLIKLLEKTDYEVDEKIKSVTLSETGINRIESMLAKNKLIPKNSSLYDFNNLSLVHYINQSLRAHFIFLENVDYIILNNKVMIIDEFTGRVMQGRRYSDGLHQAIEAKEHVPIQNENQTLASITFQNYFRMYTKLSGMTGTAMTESGEFKDIYNLEVVSVPTHNKVTRVDYDDSIYGTIQEKYRAVVQLIKDCYIKGQPVLVGTTSIEKSEDISKELTKNSIKHNILNAKMHEQEANIIAQAGRYKAVTIATNMAGRGTDIMLGGNPGIMIEHLNKNLSREEYDLEIQKIKELISKDKQKVLSAGGLYVIGTERHESRRIDNQLRGRSGRQGDPGYTKFFLSLEDDLMRIFASERISKVLRTIGLKDGEAIYHPMISRSLEKAQQKVESHNYGIRKNLLKFDNVMNDQRKIIYEQRNEIISSKDVIQFTTSMLDYVCQNLTSRFVNNKLIHDKSELSELTSEIQRIFALSVSEEEVFLIKGSSSEISSYLNQKVIKLLSQKDVIYSKSLMKSAAKYILITTVDQVWKEHLYNLDHLRQGIQLRAYGQKDPLIEYKREAFYLFEKMLNSLKELFIQRLCFLHISRENVSKEPADFFDEDIQNVHNSSMHSVLGQSSNFTKKLEKARVNVKGASITTRNPTDPKSWGKVSRNETCPCKSGKKYKHCHGLEV